MKYETRSFDEPVVVAAVGRYTPAERIGLVPGDYIISFGMHAPKDIVADNDLLGTMKRSDLLFVMRGSTAFRLGYGEGIEGATFEPAKALEDVVIPSGVKWPHYLGGIQTTGAMILVPDVARSGNAAAVVRADVRLPRRLRDHQAQGDHRRQGAGARPGAGGPRGAWAYSRVQPHWRITSAPAGGRVSAPRIERMLGPHLSRLAAV